MGWSGAAFKTICLMDIVKLPPDFQQLKQAKVLFMDLKTLNSFLTMNWKRT